MDLVKKPAEFQPTLIAAGLWGLLLGSSQLQHHQKLVKKDGESAIALDLQNIITRYGKVFEEPQELPPNQKHEHQIISKERASPVNVRPYRYAYAQENEMEQTVLEMLKSRKIRVSHSPYSSPVILVKKKKRQQWEVLC